MQAIKSKATPSKNAHILMRLQTLALMLTRGNSIFILDIFL